MIFWYKVIQELNILSSFIVTIFPFIYEKKCQSKYFSKGIIPFRWTYFCCQEILLFALRRFFFIFFASCAVIFWYLVHGLFEIRFTNLEQLYYAYILWWVVNKISISQVLDKSLLLLSWLIKLLCWYCNFWQFLC